jgi:hypothetical protein
MEDVGAIVALLTQATQPGAHEQRRQAESLQEQVLGPSPTFDASTRYHWHWHPLRASGVSPSLDEDRPRQRWHHLRRQGWGAGVTPDRCHVVLPNRVAGPWEAGRAATYPDFALSPAAPNIGVTHAPSESRSTHQGSLSKGMAPHVHIAVFRAPCAPPCAATTNTAC